MAVVIKTQAKGFVFFIVNMVLVLLMVIFSFIPVGGYGWWVSGYVGGASGIGILAIIIDVIWFVFMLDGKQRWSAITCAGGAATTGDAVVVTACIVPRWPFVLILTVLYFIAAILTTVIVARWSAYCTYYYLSYCNAPVVWIICTIIAWIAAVVRAMELYWVIQNRASYDGEVLETVEVGVGGGSV